MACPRQVVACCLTLAIIMANATQIESRSNAGNKSFHVSCHPAHWILAQMTCKQKQGAMFELDDLKKSYGLPILQAALRDVGEIWISRKKTGGCWRVGVKLKTTTQMPSGSGDNRSNTSEDRRRTNDSEPHYVPCQSHPTSSSSGYIYLTVLGVGLVLILSIIATYISVRRLRGVDGRVTEGHSNAVQNPNGTQSDNDDNSELQTQDKDDGHPVEQIDLCSVDTDNSAFLEEICDTSDDPADLSDHSEGHTDLTPSPPEDGTVFMSATYDNVTYMFGN
ncbi:uncharacterized protein LOC124257083 isoform X2 [Haliotis rubra]|uniref:uncharacterized protein LOC124257083 isoform X2 n=1 Tax=Haliotis rubra TaxID=36100 RepID=UPI001EE5A0F4|nr:uncharacterized protein LOC124257083 isoform X2 [Haliotis rubra]